MPEDQTQKTEIDTTKLATGKFTIGFGQIFNPTPTFVARITKALRYFSVSLIAMVSASDLFTPKQGKVITFALSVFILLMGAIDIITGLEPDKNTGDGK